MPHDQDGHNGITILIPKNRKSYDLETLPKASVDRALQSLFNHDPRMILTYCMARSAEVGYPRSQVSVYRTIRPLVCYTIMTNLCDPEVKVMD